MQNLNYVKKGFVVLSLLSMAHAYGGTRHDFDEMSNVFGEFNNSDSFIEFDELNTSSGNYAEVILNNSVDSNVFINQHHIGNGKNKAKVIQDKTDSSTAIVSQTGSDNTGMVEQSGRKNVAVLVQTGQDHTGYIKQDGDFNLAYLEQCSGRRCLSSYGSDISISQVNDNNIAVVIDKSNASYGINQDGDDFIFIKNSMHRSIYVEQ